MPPEPVDLLIQARWVLPIAPVNTALADHAIAVADGRIVALGPSAEIHRRFAARDRIVRDEHALLPGLVNPYTQVAMTALRGIPVRGPRSRWLETIRPLQQRLMTSELARDAARLAIAEMLLAGITTFADHYAFPEATARVAAAARIRAAVGLPVRDSESAGSDPSDGFAQAERLWDEYSSDPWVSLYFAPQNAARLTDATLVRVRRVADELDAR
ncbi:MAG TPA: amidohydrolase family protein, partial [Steroidobacteraceae bacterium]|nr:amidohydrolase family protein [Steroidobacteraceae bacterium]